MALTKITSHVIGSGAVTAASLSGITTDNVSEGSSNTYFTNARARGSVSVTGGNLSYDSSTGVIQLTTDTIRSRFSAGTGISISSGSISTSQDISTSATPTFGNITLGTVASGNITTTGYLRGPSTFTIDPATHGDNTGTVVIAGNLQVDGTTTTINSTTLTVDDKLVTLASGSANAGAANGAGIEVDISGATNPSILYDGTDDEFDFNKPITIENSSSKLFELDRSGTGNIYDLTISDAGTGAAQLFFNAQTNDTGFLFRPKNSSGNNVNALLIAPDGQLLINKTGSDVGASTNIVEADGNFRLQGGNRSIKFNNGSHEVVGLAQIASQKMQYASGRMTIDYGNSRVGIGTATYGVSPTHPLHVHMDVSNDTIDETKGLVKFQSTGGNGMIFGTLASSPYSSYIQSAYVVDTSLAQYNLALNPIGGNVGIGTSSPSHKLDVEGGNNVFDIARFGSSASDNSEITIGYFDANATNGIPGLIEASDFGGLIQGGENGHFVLGIRDNDASDALDIVSGGGNFMSDSTYDTLVASFKASGNVGIGTNPAFRFHAYHPTTNVVGRFESGDNQVWIDLHDDGSGNYGALLGHDSDANVLFQVADASVNTKFMIKGNGNVAIGTTSPSPLYWPNGSTGGLFLQAGALLSAYNAGTNLSQNWYYNAGEKFIQNGGASRYVQSGQEHIWSHSTAVNSSGAGAGLTWSESMRIDSSGLVGIGQTPSSSDGSMLQITGNDGIQLKRSGQTNGFVIRPNASTDGIRFTQGGTGDRMTINASGNVAIGNTTSPSAKLHLYTSGSEGINLGIQNSERYYNIETDGGNLMFKDVSAGGLERMRINSSGLVHIIANSTGTGLCINNDDVRISNSQTNYGKYKVAAAHVSGGTAHLGRKAANGYSTNALIAEYWGVEEVWAKGAIAYKRISSYDQGEFQWWLESTSSGAEVSSSDTKMRLERTGALHINGSLTQNASDERMKDNITLIPNALEKVKQLRGVSFTWREIENSPHEAGTEDIGVIAQDVEAVLPLIVKPAPFDTQVNTTDEGDEETKETVEVVSKSGENYKTVEYEKLVPLLIESIKELEARVAELEG